MALILIMLYDLKIGVQLPAFNREYTKGMTDVGDGRTLP